MLLAESATTTSQFVDLDVGAVWWIGLLIAIAVLLLIDLLVVHKAVSYTHLTLPTSDLV